jgi:hypothetical protein
MGNAGVAGGREDQAVGEAVRLCPGEGVTEYFRELVDAAVGRQRVGLDPMTSYYVVRLLTAFTRTDAPASGAFWSDTPMGALLGEAMASGGSEQRRRLRQVGDASLVLSGLFPNRLRRSLVDVDYYMRIGGIAYDSLSHDDGDLFATAFAELAARFGDVVDVLGDVGDRCQLGSPADLLTLYERWQRTGSERLGAQLAARGVLPVAASSRSIQ